jgi:branched-chain amino acid transport system ATP-binding protein
MRALLADRIRRLRDEGHAVLIAEQNVDLALGVADRVDVLGESGTISWSGAPAALREDTAMLQALMGV